MKIRIALALVYLYSVLGSAVVHADTPSGDDWGVFLSPTPTPTSQLPVDAFPNPNPSPSQDLGSPGSDGVSLQVIPVSLQSQCNQMVFRGTDRFKGYAFTMPRALIATDKYQQNLFGISPTADGGFILRFALHFATDNEELDQRLGTASLKDCDVDELMDEINGNLQPGEDKVATIAALPVSRIRVTVDGITTPALIGSPESNVLDYAGQTSVVEFYMNAKTKDEVMSRLNADSGSIGLGIHLDVVFTARATTGALKATIDTSQIADAIGAQFGGKVPMINVAEINLEGMVTKAIESTSASIYVEGDNLQDTAKSLISSVTGVDEYNSGIYSANQPGQFDPSSGSPADGFMPDPTQGSTGGQLINLGLFLKRLKQQKTINVNLKQMGNQVLNTFSDSILVQATTADADEKVIEISSDDPREEVLEGLDGASSISLLPQQIAVQELQSNSEDTYLDLNDIQSLKLDRYFKNLLGLDVSQIKTLHWTSGDVAAVPASDNSFFQPRSIVFGKSEILSKWGDAKTDTLAGADAPLEVAFTKLGLESRIPLSALGKDSPNWSGKTDSASGTIMFKPKRDLGNLVLLNTADPKTQSVVRSEYFEEEWDTRAHQALSRSNAGAKSEQMPTQKTTLKLLLSSDQPLAKGTSRMNVSAVQGGGNLLVVP